MLALFSVLAAGTSALAQRRLPLPLAQAPLPAGPTRIARVVDARFERSGAGVYVPIGALPPSPAEFEVPFKDALQSFFGFFAPGQAGAAPLLLRVTGLDVAEQRGNLVCAGLVADLYAPQPDSSYRLLRHLDLYQEQGSALGLGRAPHATNLGQLLLQAALLARDPASWVPAGPVRPAAYVQAPEPHPAEQLPILDAAQPLRPGYYHALTEFWENAPSEPGMPDLDKRPYTGSDWMGEQEVKGYRRTPDGRRVAATDVWGACDGQDLYVRRYGVLCRLRREGSHFVFTGRVGESAGLHTAHTALNVVALAGGYYSTGGMPERPAPMSLHPLTGAVQLVEAPEAVPAPLASRPTQLYIYRPRAARGEAVRVQLPGGEPARELPAGEYVSYQVAGGQPVQVCLLPAGGSAVCQAVTPAPEQTTYLEYRPGQPLLPVAAKVGAAALERLAR